MNAKFCECPCPILLSVVIAKTDMDTYMQTVIQTSIQTDTNTTTLL